MQLPDGLVIDWCGGACPTQAEGTIDGHPFYFRARHGVWSLLVAATTYGDACAISWERPDLIAYTEEGADPSYGYMGDADVLAILVASQEPCRATMQAWRTAHPDLVQDLAI